MKTATGSQLVFRVLLTDWEAEQYVECWCKTEHEARRVASCIAERDCSVQVDEYIDGEWHRVLDPVV